MKNKIIAIIIILLVLFGLFYLLSLKEVTAPTPEPIVQNQEPQVNVPEGWKTYSNFGFQISYPPAWFVDEVGLDSSGNVPSSVRFTGDGYIFSIGINLGMGFDPDCCRDVPIEVGGYNITAKESIDPDDWYGLTFRIDLVEGYEWYLFRISARPEVNKEEAKIMTSKVLGTVKIFPR